jgi:RNA polymerase sigma-B factor
MSPVSRTARPYGGAGFTEYAATRDPALRDELITANVALARHLAHRFANRGEPYDDLLQVATVGIIMSVDRFDPARGVEFSTFATKTVIGELKRHFRDRGWAVRAPRRVQELCLEVSALTASMSQELGRSPTVAELAARTGATDEAVIEALEAARGYRSSSLDADGREDALAERLGTDDRAFDGVDDRTTLSPAVAGLPARQQTILRLRFVEGLTQSEIARRVGLSQMHVSRLLTASLAQLRRALINGTRTDRPPEHSSPTGHGAFNSRR